MMRRCPSQKYYLRRLPNEKVAMLHTSAATLAMMQQLIADIMPEVEVMHWLKNL